MIPAQGPHSRKIRRSGLNSDSGLNIKNADTSYWSYLISRLVPPASVRPTASWQRHAWKGGSEVVTTRWANERFRQISL